jgi:hypothetical protein
MEQTALRREELESKHCANQAAGRKVRPIIDVTSTALRKKETAVCM